MLLLSSLRRSPSCGFLFPSCSKVSRWDKVNPTERDTIISLPSLHHPCLFYAHLFLNFSLLMRKLLQMIQITEKQVLSVRWTSDLHWWWKAYQWTSICFFVLFTCETVLSSSFLSVFSLSVWFQTCFSSLYRPPHRFTDCTYPSSLYHLFMQRIYET